MNLIIIILSILLVISILYILYIKLNNTKKVRFNTNNITNSSLNIQDKDYKEDKKRINYDEMSFLAPDYEKKRLEELKFDMI